jgi:hypothetical protein
MPRGALAFRRIRDFSFAFAVFILAIVALTRQHTVLQTYSEHQERLEESSIVAAPASPALFGPPRYEYGEVPQSLSFIKGKGRFCVNWSEDDANKKNGITSLDEWWTHHIEYVLDKANDTHLCLKLQHAESDQYLYQLRLYFNQFHTTCDRIHQRYMWSSGWGEFYSHFILI